MGTWAWIQRWWSWKAEFKVGLSITYNWVNVFNQAKTAACICQNRFSRFLIMASNIFEFVSFSDNWNVFGSLFETPDLWLESPALVSNSQAQLFTEWTLNKNRIITDYQFTGLTFEAERESWAQREEAWISTGWNVQEIENRKNTIEEKARTCWDKGVDYVHLSSHRLDLEMLMLLGNRELR